MRWSSGIDAEVAVRRPARIAHALAEARSCPPASTLSRAVRTPRGMSRLGAPYYVCAALQLCAMVLTLRHFRRLPADTPGTAVPAQA